jgi:hypothetical protein
MSSPNCSYCKTTGHNKYTCPVLSRKTALKKSDRVFKALERHNANLVKKWGDTPEGMQRLWDDSQMKIDSFRVLEDRALGNKSLSELEYNTLANELASLEKEYEAALDFQRYVKNSDICFSPKEKNVLHGTKNFYSEIEKQTTGLSDISSKLDEMLDDEMTSAGDSIEYTLICASDYYWKTQYKKGRGVFYDWLDATVDSRKSVNRILTQNSWKTVKATDVLDLSTVEKTKKTKMVMPRTSKKKSQKQKLLETETMKV